MSPSPRCSGAMTAAPPTSEERAIGRKFEPGHKHGLRGLPDFRHSWWLLDLLLRCAQRLLLLCSLQEFNLGSNLVEAAFDE
jgi:hypothetical protein